MELVFNHDQWTVLLRIILAYLIGSFLLSPGMWNERWKLKDFRSVGLYLDAIIYGILVYLFLPGWNNGGITAMVVFYTLVINLFKVIIKVRGAVRLFIVEQLLHLFGVLFVWLVYINGWEMLQHLLRHVIMNNQFLLIVIGYVFCTRPAAFIIDLVLQSLPLPSNEGTEIADSKNIENAGYLIGIFERCIIITMVLLNQYEAIGFLITGKSILRFRNDSSHSEYVLVGTMLSYALSIVVGVLISLALSGVA